MTTSFVIQLGREMIFTALLVVGPILLVSFLTGVIMSLIQSSMNLHEMTLSVVPKFFAIGVTTLIMGHWMLRNLTEYSEKLLMFTKVVLP